VAKSFSAAKNLFRHYGQDGLVSGLWGLGWQKKNVFNAFKAAMQHPVNANR
jgi:hypothetical protein